MAPALMETDLDVADLRDVFGGGSDLEDRGSWPPWFTCAITVHAICNIGT